MFFPLGAMLAGNPVKAGQDAWQTSTDQAGEKAAGNWVASLAGFNPPVPGAQPMSPMPGQSSQPLPGPLAGLQRLVGGIFPGVNQPPQPSQGAPTTGFMGAGGPPQPAPPMARPMMAPQPQPQPQPQPPQPQPQPPMGGGQPPMGGGQSPVGMMSLEQIVQGVARSNPGAPPAVLFSAIKALTPLMNAQALMQYRQAQVMLGQERIGAMERGQDIRAGTAERGQDITARGQDIRAGTAERGQDITARGQDIRADTSRYGTDVRAETQRYGIDTRADTAREAESGRERRSERTEEGRERRSVRTEEGRQRRAELSATTKKEITSMSAAARKELQEYLEAGRMERAEQTRTSREGVAERAEAGRTQRAELSANTKKEVNQLSVGARREIVEYLEAGRMERAEQARTSREGIAERAEAGRQGRFETGEAGKQARFEANQQQRMVIEQLHSDQRFKDWDLRRQQLERQIQQGGRRLDIAERSRLTQDWRAILDAQHKLAMEKIQSVAAGMGAKERKELIDQENAAYVGAISRIRQQIEGGMQAPTPGTVPPAGYARVKTPEEAEKLPPGTKYITPDGREYTR